MDGGAWWAEVHGVAKSQTQLNDFTFTFQFHALEKEMATHSSVLAWRLPGAGEPRGLPSMGSQRVGHDWSDLAAAAAASLWTEVPVNSGDKIVVTEIIYKKTALFRPPFGSWVTRALGKVGFLGSEIKRNVPGQTGKGSSLRTFSL